MKSIAIYARVSSEQQAQQATVESQVVALKERATADGHLVLPQDIYIDEGFSGSTLIRPSLERLRDRAAEGAFEILYVHAPDRLARKYAYQVLLLDEFRQLGVTPIFLHGPSGQTAEDELLVQVQGMIAEYERAKILERCRRGKIHRARQGSVSPMSAAPYGFTYIKKSDHTPASYQVLLPKAKVVREIFHALVHEQKSIGEIVRNLNAQGIPTSRGTARWEHATVWSILQNPAYMGQAAFGKTERTESRKMLRPRRWKSPTSPRKNAVVKRRTLPETWISIRVPAIVSRDVFDAAKAQLERNKQFAQRNAKGQRYLLRGLTVCGRCGYALYGRTRCLKGKEPLAYYRCYGTDAHRFAGTQVCHNPQVRVDQLDSYVWQSVCDLLRNPQRILNEWSRRQHSDGLSGELRQQRDEAARLLAIHERSLQRLVDAYEIGAVDLEQLKTRSDAARKRIEDAKSELATAEQKLQQTVHLRAVVSHLEDFADRIQKGLDTMSWLDRQHIIRTLVTKIEIDEQGATVVYRVPSTKLSSEEPSDTSQTLGTQKCQLRKGSSRGFA